jgi:hypothetical protein
MTAALMLRYVWVAHERCASNSKIFLVRGGDTVPGVPVRVKSHAVLAGPNRGGDIKKRTIKIRKNKILYHVHYLFCTSLICIFLVACSFTGRH